MTISTVAVPVARGRRRAWTSTLLTATAFVASMTTPAQAAWSAQGSGAGGAAADRLAAPAKVTSACGLLAVGASSLTVSWEWPSSAGFPPDRFEIDRSTDGGASWSSAGSVVAGVATMTFEDKGLSVLGTYHYRVTAAKGNWRTSAMAPPRTIVLGVLGLINVCS
jgi:hypothetical protein